MMKMRIIIIGAVAAGTGAATKARRNLPNAEIVIYEKDTTISYSGCGMPYFIKGEVKQAKSLAPRTPQFFKEKNNIDIKIAHEVLSIDPLKKEVVVKNLTNKETFIDHYDKLVIATGARSLLPPIDGIGLPHVFSLRNINDMHAIKNHLDTHKIKSAAVIGAGFIGLELLEALTALDVETTLIERLEQVSPGLDEEMAMIVKMYLEEKSIAVFTGKTAVKITNEAVILDTKEEIQAQIVIVSTGVRPNTEIAEAAGIQIGAFKGILVNSYLETNLPDVYACGDATEQYHLLLKQNVYRPLGSTANKTGRIVGDNLAGKKSSFPGVMGTAIYRVFDLHVAQTGLSEKEAMQAGYEIETIRTEISDKPKYMGGQPLHIKTLADKKTRKLLGAQIIGTQGVDKRIDVLATAITFGATTDDLIHLDLAYAPPFSNAKDPIHYIGMIFEGVFDKE